MHPRPSGITAMPLILTIVFGITLVYIKFRKVKPIPIPLKATILSYAIISHDWSDHLVVSLVARMHLNAQFACLSTPLTAGNFTSKDFLLILLMSKILLAQSFSHSDLAAKALN